MKIIRCTQSQQWHQKKRLKFFHLVLMGIFLSVLLGLTGCGDGGGGYSSSDYHRLESENRSLQDKNSQLQKELDDCRNRNGYLFVSTWVAGFSCVALFCVGLACGWKIKKLVLANEK
jgi:hypothetical protein